MCCCNRTREDTHTRAQRAKLHHHKKINILQNVERKSKAKGHFKQGLFVSASATYFNEVLWFSTASPSLCRNNNVEFHLTPSKVCTVQCHTHTELFTDEKKNQMFTEMTNFEEVSGFGVAGNLTIKNVSTRRRKQKHPVLLVSKVGFGHCPQTIPVPLLVPWVLNFCSLLVLTILVCCYQSYTQSYFLITASPSFTD